MPIDFKHTSRLLPRTVRHINLQINLLVALLRVDAEGLRLVEQRVAEDTAKIEALRQATSIGIMDLEHGRFTQVNEGDLEHYLESLSLEATLPAREKH